MLDFVKAYGSAAMKIRLRFLNLSHDVNHPRVFLFQRNYAMTREEEVIPWKVIERCGFGWFHPFTFSTAASVVVHDGNGVYTPVLSAERALCLRVWRDLTGRLAVEVLPSESLTRIDVTNGTRRGALQACVLRDGRLLALQDAILPGQVASFDLRASIVAGADCSVVEGEKLPMTSAAEFYDELDLNGVASADLVMNGGGPGADSTPLRFSLRNVRNWPPYGRQ